ncbi:hypothetical protein KL938_004328 [Ogataea parapolymorpha]|nr:hypothetical protein KL938_004328 [Ogataea parapolymorpha]
MDQLDAPIPLEIGYYDPFSLYAHLKKDLETITRIDKLHWKPGPASSVRTLSNIKLNYVQSTDNKYLNFIFISSTSIDEYRARVRPVVKQWLNNVKSAKPTSVYFIILYENTSHVSRTEKLLKTNLLNKLKTDFVDEMLTFDNIFKIKSSYPSAVEKREVWAGLANSVKIGLVESIGHRLAYYCSRDTLDSMNELAHLFMSIGQLEDALYCYKDMFAKVDKLDLDEGIESCSFKDLPLADSAPDIDYKSRFKLKAFFYKQSVTILRKTATSEALMIRTQMEWMQVLSRFIESLDESYKKNEIAVVLITDFLNNAQLQKLLGGAERDLAELYEKLGDIRILRRNELIKLAHCKGYVLAGSLVDIPMHSEKYKPLDDAVKSILESESKFQEYAIDETKKVIEEYSKAQSRPRTVDTLSTELALIYFHNMKKLETSLEILNDSFTYFKNSEWKYITLGILKIFIANLEQLSATYEDVLPVLLTSYLELVAKDEPFESDKLSKILDNLTDPVVFESTDLFDCDLAPCIDPAGVDTYELGVRITSKIVLPVDEIVVNFENTQFRLGSCCLEKHNNYKLESKDLVCGDLEARSIVVRSGKLEIRKTLYSRIFAYPIEQFYKNGQVLQNTVIDAVVPRVRNLNRDEIMLVARVGSEKLPRCEFVFHKTDIDRMVPKAEYVVESNGEVVDTEVKNDVDQLVFKCNCSFSPGSTVTVRIPYFFPPEVSNTIVPLSFGLVFGDHSVYVTKYLDTQLQIAVSVQDIFKSAQLFSNYSINSPIHNRPVRVQKVDLTSQNSKVVTWKQPRNIIAFNDQGSTFFYKIESLSDESLNLQIDYNDIEDEIVVGLEKMLEKQILSEEPELIKYSNILRTFFRAQKPKLNHYSLTNCIKTDPFETRHHQKVLSQLHPADAQSLVDRLRGFFGRSYDISPDLQQEFISASWKQLNIVVTLPVINTINIVEFRFAKQLQYLVCEPIHTRLSLHVILFKLEEKENKKVRFQNEPEIPKNINLKLDLVENENNWLIAGLKNFDLELDLQNDKSAAYEFDLVLTPLRVGKLELPRVEIKNKSDFQIQMELDYKNSSENLLVVSELNKVTYSF